MPETVLTNARLVLPGEIVAGSLRLSGGRIATVDGGASALPGAVDCGGAFLAPGFVEIHTDHCEKHLSPRPGVAWPAFPAILAHDAQIAAAGITTVFDALSIGMIDEMPERVAMVQSVLEALAAGRSADALRADHRLHLRCEVSSPDLLDLFHPLKDEPAVGLLSLMDHTPGDRQYRDVEKFKRAFAANLPSEAEAVDRQIAELQEARDKVSGASRQAVAVAARARGLPLASHDDATGAHVAEAARLGCSISEFPTTLAAARAAHASGLKTVAGAPNVVRGGSHTGNVAAAVLVEEGLLDGLSSDYMPVSLLQAPFHLARALSRPLWEMIALVTSGPAGMVGLQDRGRIAPGLRADLVRIEETPNGPVAREVWREGRRVA